MKTFRWILFILALAFVGCESADDLDGPAYAKGGQKGKPKSVIVDSVTLLPPDSVVPMIVGDTLQFHVLFWIDGAPYLRCKDDNRVWGYDGVFFDACEVEGQ